MTMSKALQAFGKAPEVLYAEPNYIVNTFATPNDTCYPELWGMNNIGQTGGTADADIDAPEAWNLTTGTTNVVVAVIDTGVDYTHPDLAANMFQDPVDGSYGINVVSGTTDPMDDNGHGTHVSGIIGAVGNNSLGVVGVNWNVQILACKFLDATGTGTNAGAIACLDYVASMKDRGFKIVATNNSYGGGAYSQALHDAIDAQRQRGILFIAAAGNFRSDNETLQTYPASYSLPNILSIASTDASDNLSFFSNYGKRVVHIAAPGENILSTVPGGYEFYNGTSMATPHVTGVAALIHALYPGSDWRSVKNRILAGGDAKDALTQTTVTGRRLNVYGALTCSNSIVLNRLQPFGSILSVGLGTPIELAALHVKCAEPNGNVIVTVSPSNEMVTLLDNGIDNDQVAGDGIYTATWMPLIGGTFTLAFPGGDNVTVNVDPDLQAGFPVKAWHQSGGYMGGPGNHTLVANVDNASNLEIFVASHAGGPLNAWNNAGIPLSGWPIYTNGAPYPAAGELSSVNVGNEVFSASQQSDEALTAYNGLGAMLPGWPRNSVNNFIGNPPSLSDVDNDGLDEIFVEEYDNQLHGYKADGTILSGWPVPGNGQLERHTSAIADLDKDGDLEIITTCGPYETTLYA
jgi:hypothetical protein